MRTASFNRDAKGYRIERFSLCDVGRDAPKICAGISTIVPAAVLAK
ncbi:MAG TPA: hypothetical protein VJT11_02765 [Nitrospiraceae bacterium]|nr:hypothetical protein [Nitrospiraceae bacterium]